MLAIASIFAGTAVGGGLTLVGLRIVLRILEPRTSKPHTSTPS
jgi:hypothetical protein